MITHHFPVRCYDIPKLLDGCHKINTFISRLSTQANMHPETIPPNVYLGDGFEAFGESLINQFPSDARISITGYIPVIGIKDLGVDGVGTGVTGPHTVQLKAKSDPTSYLGLNADHLSNFFAYSINEYSATRLTIITNCAGIAGDVWKKVLGPNVRVLNNTDLQKMVDNSEMFWMTFKKHMEERQIRG